MLWVKATIEIRIKAVALYKEGIRNVREIGETESISEMTVRPWAKAHS